MRQLKITKQITNRESKSLDKYLQEVGALDLIDPEQEVELATRIKQGDRKAMEKLVKANLRFVISVSKQYQNQGLALNDLINEGNFGLIKAAKRFDETRGFKFISYAVWWIRQSILQALAEHSRIVRLPLNRIGALNKINRATNDFEQKNERLPSNEELSQKLEIPEHSIEGTLKAGGKHISIDAPLSEEDEDSNLLEIMQNNDEPYPDKELTHESLKSEIKQTLCVLTEKEKAVLCFYYGINGKMELSLDEIGQKLGLTRERVRQIREKAIKKLRGNKKTDRLKAFLG